MYGKLDCQDSPNHEDCTATRRLHGAVQGLDAKGNLKAVWGMPGAEWRLKDEHMVRTDERGRFYGTKMQHQAGTVYFDPVQDGVVIGGFDVERKLRKFKGVYDIDANPVHRYGPEARPNIKDAQRTFRSIQDRREAEMSSAPSSATSTPHWRKHGAAAESKLRTSKRWRA
ncbi:hypothetical protein CBOM_02228 [Ceraceosorus bombacis]|uniref:Uncharacterized protein n=1 Tax=Ceraceosorus bombacis TaxID=401625 RepID=A0A0P1BFE3_9BASI|nr:hypothetical protein CBOM_02228 [Ceraceosorus bombacis]